MDHFDPLKINLPSCPNNTEIQKYLAYPTVTIVYIILCLMSFIFGIWTACRYNKVTVYNEQVTKPSISNTQWVFYFFAIAFRSIADILKYSLINNSTPALDTALVVISLVLYGVTALSLSLALNHQRVYRSSLGQREGESISSNNIKAPPPPKKSGSSFSSASLSPALVVAPRESQSLVINEDKEKGKNDTFLGLETPLCILFVIYCLAIYALFQLQDLKEYEQIFWIIMLTVYSLQRLPNVILVTIIVVYSNRKEGPRLETKVLLIVATVINVVNDLPLPIWASLIGRSGCAILSIASWVDLVHLFYCIAQLLYFLFLRSEFLRNKESCMWHIVNEKQDLGFYFKEFQQ